MKFLEAIRGYTRRLQHVHRYSNTPVVGDKENVAAHSWYVTFYAMTMAEHLFADGYDVNIEGVMKKAILHDWEESLTGDIVHTARNSSPEVAQAVRSLSAAAQKQLAADFPPSVRRTLERGCERAKGEGLEGRLVALADYIAVWSFAWEQIEQGNRANFYPVLENSINLSGKVMDDIWKLNPHVGQSLDEFLVSSSLGWREERRVEDNGIFDKEHFLNTRD